MKLKSIFLTCLICLLCVVGLGVGGSLWYRNNFQHESRVTALSFENIGELATQTAYTTTVDTMENQKDFFGATIPFTQTKYIYSYDSIIKAGFDFTQITYQVDEVGKVIKVKLPNVKVISNEIQTDSLVVYQEKDSIFTNISLEERTEALAELNAKALEKAKKGGLMELAKENAISLLINFFAQAYSNDYEFEWN